MNKRKITIITALILALVLALGLGTWMIASTLESDPAKIFPTEEPTPLPSNMAGEDGPFEFPKDDYALDFQNGTPWWNAEASSGEYSYSNGTMLAFTKNGVYGIVFQRDHILPPSHSEVTYFGESLSPELYSTAGFEDMERESNGVRYVISAGWIDPGTLNYEVPGAEYGWITATFSRVPLTTQFLRSQPWREQIKRETGADMSDSWWDGRVVAQEYKISCPSGELTGRLAVDPNHSWIINQQPVPEQMLLKDGCTIEG